MASRLLLSHYDAESLQSSYTVFKTLVWLTNILKKIVAAPSPVLQWATSHTNDCTLVPATWYWQEIMQYLLRHRGQRHREWFKIIHVNFAGLGICIIQLVWKLNWSYLICTNNVNFLEGRLYTVIVRLSRSWFLSEESKEMAFLHVHYFLLHQISSSTAKIFSFLILSMLIALWSKRN